VVLAERTMLLGGITALSFGRVWIPANHYAPTDTPRPPGGISSACTTNAIRT
jgi:hypothetical protein